MTWIHWVWNWLAFHFGPACLVYCAGCAVLLWWMDKWYGRHEGRVPMGDEVFVDGAAEGGSWWTVVEGFLLIVFSFAFILGVLWLILSPLATHG